MAKLMAFLLACNLVCMIQAATICEHQSVFWQRFNEVANDLFKATVAENPGENVIISPVSVQTVLALAYMGATGETAQQMSHVLRMDGLNKSVIADNYRDLIQDVTTSSSVKIANKIYVLEDQPLKAEFNEVASKKFRTEAEGINFAENNQAAATINQWVEEKTDNQIKDLISPDALNEDTQMVLVNAIYFKGLWQIPFKVANTTEKPFWVSETESVEVDMMHSKDRFKYVDLPELDCTGLELAYNKSEVIMVILLPNQRTGLADLEEQLNKMNFTDISKQMEKLEVTVELPRFKIEFSVSMKDTLEKMGMDHMFSENAEFCDLLGGEESLKVSDVVHKAFIEVNEEGVEAAAATGVIVTTRSKPKPITFRADHPFLFALKLGEETVFLGHYLHN